MDAGVERLTEVGRGLTRARFLARGGVAGLAILGWEGGLGGLEPALAATGPAPIRTFITRPDLRPPRLTIRHPARGTPDGYLFIAPTSGPGQRGTLIFDNHGEPIWFRPVTPVSATAFRASTLRGKSVLTWWEGTYSNEGLGHGVYVIVDSSYREVARIKAGGYRDGDLHEFRLTDEGTALVTKNAGVRRDLTAYGGGPNGLLYSGVVQEVAIPSGRVLFEWTSLDHVAVEESHALPNRNHFDYFHINSIDVDADGHLLVSARNTWAVYKIHRRTGKVLWRLGGRKSDFAMGPGTVTAWQHDARSHDGGRVISIFDNGAAPQVQTQSRVILVRLDLQRMRATLERAYKHRPNRVVAKFMGSGQVLPDGGVVAGWGSEPFVTEFAPNGSIRFEALMPKGGQNYRAFRFPWKGAPSVPPRVKAGVSKLGRGIFVSWNGATEVASWALRYGPSAGEIHDGRLVPRSGFETYLGRLGGERWAEVVALDANGKVLGRSKPQRL
jgi:hypothetical protein